jgi:hypothetical protein
MLRPRRPRRRTYKRANTFQAPTVPNRKCKRPEDEPERPACEVDPLRRLRLEAVRVEPRRPRVRELVSGQPEVVRRLQVVARRDDSGPRLAVREELVAVLEERGGEGECAGGEVERAGERYNARAAASGTSKSGTSPGS